MWEWIIKSFFPYRLKALRESQGKSQEQLAKILNVNQRTISNWEKAKAQPSLEKLIHVAYIFKVDTNYLMCIDEETHAILFDAVSKNQNICPDNKFTINYLQEKIKDIPFISETSFNI